MTHEVINRLKDVAGSDPQEIVIENLPYETRAAITTLLLASYTFASDKLNPFRIPNYRPKNGETLVANFLAIKEDDAHNRTTLKIIGEGRDGLPAYQMQTTLERLHQVLMLDLDAGQFPSTPVNADGIDPSKKFLVMSFPDRVQAELGMKLYSHLAQAQGFRDPNEIFSVYEGIEMGGRKYPSILVSEELFKALGQKEKLPDIRMN